MREEPFTRLDPARMRDSDLAEITGLLLFVIKPSDRALAGWGQGDWPASCLAMHAGEKFPQQMPLTPRTATD